MELLQVTDNPQEHRYEIRADEELAFLEYQKKNTQTIFLHTVVPPELEGNGIGSALARRALLDAIHANRWQIPLCPFVRGYVLLHPDYQDNPAYYQLLKTLPEPAQELLLHARSMIVDVVPDRVVEIPMVDEQMVGYAEKGGKFTDNLCWFAINPDGLALYFNEEIDLSRREELSGGFLPIRSIEDLQSPIIRSLVLAAWQAVE